MCKIKIIHFPSKDEQYAVIFKPAGLPSAPYSEDDNNNAFAQTAEELPEILQVSGRKEIEHGLLHRLDTATSGLLLIASSQESYDFLLEAQKAGLFIKTYEAVCKRFPENSEILGGFPPANFTAAEIINTESAAITIESCFRNYGNGAKEVRPVTEKAGQAALKKCRNRKIYKTEISIHSFNENRISAKCRITAGYRHQVRCHLAWAGLPILGDRIYNAQEKNNDEAVLNFKASAIEFPSPATGRIELYEC